MGNPDEILSQNSILNFESIKKSFKKFKMFKINKNINNSEWIKMN